ncbi:universal stress protein, partial [Haloferax sp. Atlit-6N]
DRAEAAIDETVARLPDGVDVERDVVMGIPQDQILDQIERADADVVVMGTHSRSGIDRYLIGSVTERVMRHASVPVLTVRDDGPDA